MKVQKKGFTLVEMLISISIFSIIMVSIMSVYLISTKITQKSYINRIIHENTKNVIITISEDIMKNGISGVSESVLHGDCGLEEEGLSKGNKFCSKESEYYLAKKSSIGGTYIRTEIDDCKDLKNQCYLVKDGKPITNDLVRVTDLNFFVTFEEIKKVTMSLTLKPSKTSQLGNSLIDSNTLNTQVTLSERKYKD